MALRRQPSRTGTSSTAQPAPTSHPHAPLRSSSLRHAHSAATISSPPPAPHRPAKPHTGPVSRTPSSRLPSNRTSRTPRRVGPGGQILMDRYSPDRDCAFCEGTAGWNKAGRPEELVSCWECGSSGHPTCLDMPDMRMVQKVNSYPWMCQECKRCEVCDEKGDDGNIMFCDSCDRGWHGLCLDPPVAKIPRTKFICPTCRKTPGLFDMPVDFALPKRGVVLKASVTPVASPTGVTTAKSVDKQPPRASVVTFKSSQIEKGKEKAHRNYADEVGPRIKLPGGYVERGRSVPSVLKGSSALKLTLKFAKGTKAAADVDHEGHDDPPEDVDTTEAEEDGVPYGGILNEDEADPGDRKPVGLDRSRWETARDETEQKALRELAAAGGTITPGPVAEASGSGYFDQPSTSHVPLRNRESRATASFGPPSVADTPSRAGSAPPAGSVIPIANIKMIVFGEFEIVTWYQAPFPEEFSRVADGRLYICEFCLKYMRGEFQANRHKLKCKTRHPPGDEIYRDGQISVFEIDGRKNKIYCQNLCLLSKMFLDHKTLYYDVEPFLFYVMTTSDITGAKFVGYFSKEKRSPTNNVSCIMTLPVRQRKGWGNLLIDFSYLLSKKEGRRGTPERPLSDLGLLSYRNYWTLTLFTYLNSTKDGDNIRVEEISAQTAMTHEDIVFVLRERHMIVDLDVAEDEDDSGTSPDKQHRFHGNQWTTRKRNTTFATATVAGSSSRQPHHDPHATPAVIVPLSYRIEFDRTVVDEFLQKWERKDYLYLRSEKLQWTPFLVTRGYGLDIPVGSTAKLPSGPCPIGSLANGNRDQDPSANPLKDLVPSTSGSEINPTMTDGVDSRAMSPATSPPPVNGSAAVNGESAILENGHGSDAGNSTLTAEEARDMVVHDLPSSQTKSTATLQETFEGPQVSDQRPAKRLRSNSLSSSSPSSAHTSKRQRVVSSPGRLCQLSSPRRLTRNSSVANGTRSRSSTPDVAEATIRTIRSGSSRPASTIKSPRKVSRITSPIEEDDSVFPNGQVLGATGFAFGDAITDEDAEGSDEA